jgi:endonuclease/exonuclease/phosphatase family metal-dependent hydrolase
MRVMSWNLWWRFGDAWRERGQAILSTLEALGPDVAGLQEVWGTAEATQADQLAERLGMHAAFGAPSLPPPPRPPARPDQAGVEVGVAVLSRWPILEVRHHRLPSRHRPEIVALEAIVDHPQGPMHVVASCIDWEREFAAQRLTQTRALAALLTDPARDGPLPALLTADLNAPPTTPEIRALTDVMVDAWVAAGGAADDGHTLSAGNPLAPRAAWWLMDQRIDYVLARPGTPAHPVVVERAFVAGEPRDGLYPSDHDAVVADLEVEAVSPRPPGRSPRSGGAWRPARRR